jgi:tRNA threonylcarbamoyladenosine biosynthesis protein TsaB
VGHSLWLVLLAFDTATAAVTVALADLSSGAADIVAESTVVDTRRHGELLAPGIERVMRVADVDRSALTAIAVGVGPGPFTGLRVGLVTARTMAAVLGIPVHGVCTLDAMALGSGLAGAYRVLTDARRKEVYWAAYDGTRRVDGPHVHRPASVAWDGPAVGHGAQLWSEHFPDRRGPEHPAAADLARWVAQGLPTLDAEPLYLRRPDAVEPAARKRVGT